MMIVKKFTLVILFAVACTGCGESNDEQALRVAVDFLGMRITNSKQTQERLALQSRIPRAVRVQGRIDRGLRVLNDIELTPELRLRLEFALPAQRAALNLLATGGLKSLQSPLVLWGVMREHAPTHRPYLQLEWLDLGSNVTGFYLEIDGGKTLAFPKTIDPRDELFSRLAENNDPLRVHSLLFSQTENAPEERIFRLSAESYHAIIEEQKILRAGLILKDGTKTNPGPVAYMENYESAVQKLNNEEPSSEE